MRGFSPVNQKERELLEVVGAQPSRFQVIARRPWTIALGTHAYLPGLVVGLIAFAVVARDNPVASVPAALVAALVMTLCLAVHEAGHLLFGRLSRGVKPRMLVLFSGGGISILEGRHEDPRGAALFAAGGPIASTLASLALICAAVLVPSGPFAFALVIPAALTLVMTVVNLLPIAPMDGYTLFRSWLWSNLGNRAEAERVALDWSRVVIAFLIACAAVALLTDREAGVAALVMCTAFVVQHHKVFNRVMAEAKRPDTTALHPPA